MLGMTTSSICRYLGGSPSGTYTEGSGVQPDVPIDIDPDRLAYGEDAQINKALELLE